MCDSFCSSARCHRCGRWCGRLLLYLFAPCTRGAISTKAHTETAPRENAVCLCVDLFVCTEQIFAIMSYYMAAHLYCFLMMALNGAARGQRRLFLNRFASLSLQLLTPFDSLTRRWANTGNISSKTEKKYCANTMITTTPRSTPTILFSLVFLSILFLVFLPQNP